jgi:hypothetical protein
MAFVNVVVNTTKDSFTDPFNYKKQLGDSIVGGLVKKNPKAAVLTQEQQDAAATAKAQTDAAVAANQLRVQQKRAYQANALALGGFTDDSLGAPGGSGMPGAGSILSQGASVATRAAAASSTSGYTGGTALGAGASSGGGYGGGSSSRTPVRSNIR